MYYTVLCIFFLLSPPISFCSHPPNPDALWCLVLSLTTAKVVQMCHLLQITLLVPQDTRKRLMFLLDCAYIQCKSLALSMDIHTNTMEFIWTDNWIKLSTLAPFLSLGWAENQNLSCTSVIERSLGNDLDYSGLYNPYVMFVKTKWQKNRLLSTTVEGEPQQHKACSTTHLQASPHPTPSLFKNPYPTQEVLKTMSLRPCSPSSTLLSTNWPLVKSKHQVDDVPTRKCSRMNISDEITHTMLCLLLGACSLPPLPQTWGKMYLRGPTHSPTSLPQSQSNVHLRSCSCCLCRICECSKSNVNTSPKEESLRDSPVAPYSSQILGSSPPCKIWLLENTKHQFDNITDCERSMPNIDDETMCSMSRMSIRPHSSFLPHEISHQQPLESTKCQFNNITDYKHLRKSVSVSLTTQTLFPSSAHPLFLFTSNGESNLYFEGSKCHLDNVPIQKHLRSNVSLEITCCILLFSSLFFSSFLVVLPKPRLHLKEKE